MKEVLVQVFTGFFLILGGFGIGFIPTLDSSLHQIVLMSGSGGLIIWFLTATFLKSGQHTFSLGIHSGLFVLSTLVLIQCLGGIHFEWNSLLLLAAVILVSSSAGWWSYSSALIFLGTGMTGLFMAQNFSFIPVDSYILWEINRFQLTVSSSVLGISLLILWSHSRLGNSFKLNDSKSSENNEKEVSQTIQNGALEEENKLAPESDLWDHSEDTQAKMKSVLELVLFFINRNFNAFSAVGFLKLPGDNVFKLTASNTKSTEIDQKAKVFPGKGIVGKSVAKVKGFVSGDLKNYPGTLEYYKTVLDINSIMVVPILDSNEKEILGILSVDSEKFRAFTDDHRELMQRFSKIATAMLSNILLNQKVEEQASWVDHLYSVSNRLNSALKVEEVFELMATVLNDIFKDFSIVLCRYEPLVKKGRVWRLLGKEKGNEEIVFPIDNPNSVYGYVIKSGKKVFLKNFDKKEAAVRFQHVDENCPAELLVLPICNDLNNVVGAVGLESKVRGYINKQDFNRLKALLMNFSNGISKAESYDKLERLATVDGLTQIANHRKFQDVLDNEISRCKRYGENVTLLLMDIDHFKKFNDTYGHTVGDDVLKVVAKTLTAQIRDTDLCARYGGEEFVVVIIKTDPAEAIRLAERIRDAIEKNTLKHEGNDLKVTVSIGSATYPFDSESKQELIEKADQAMYYSKEHGRNQVTAFKKVKASSKP